MSNYDNERTIRLSVIRADTVRMPSVAARAGFLIEHPCDGAGIIPHTDKHGVTRLYCRLCHYVEKCREYTR